MARFLYKHRRGTTSDWNNKGDEIIPLEGEIVIEIDIENNSHKLKIGDGAHTYSELKYLMAGDEIVSQALSKALPRVITVTLDVDKWAECDNSVCYSQATSIEGITKYSRLDLQPDANMLAELKALGVSFVTENINGEIIVYSVGTKPTATYTMQGTIVETDVEDNLDKIVGIPVGNDLVTRKYTNNMFNNALKGKKSGQFSVVIDDISPIEHDVEIKICSKNLILRPYVQGNTTQFGVTCTENADGSVTINGTFTPDETYANPEFKLADFTVKESGTYTFSGVPANSSMSTAFMYITNNSNGDMFTLYNSGDGVLAYQIQLIAGHNYSLNIVCLGSSFDNMVFKPQIELGGTPTEFTPGISKYGANIVIHGKNLFNPNAPTTKIASAYTGVDIAPLAKVCGSNLRLKLTLKEGKTMPTDCMFGFVYNQLNKNTGKIGPNAIWILSGSGINNLYKDGAQITKDWATEIGIGAYFVDGSGINGAQAYAKVLDTFDIQLEVGTYSTDYEPYSFSYDYTINDNGMIEVPSVGRAIITSNAGSLMSVAYNRDINLVIDNLERTLEQVAIALGGNI